jgi:hypothetical protein
MIRRRLCTLRCRIRHRLQRAKRAFAYAIGTLSVSQAHDIIADCEFVAGCFPLMTLATQDVMDMAIAEYGDRAHALKDYLLAACAHVARKYECFGDEYWHARSWAVDTAKECAAQDGLQLVSKTEDDFNATTSSEGEPAHA